MKLIGVDVGGTFTDVVLFDSETNETAVHKVPTTSDDPSRGVMQGVLDLCRSVAIDPGAITHVYHGTTIATNAVLEYKGARTGMITTKGYRDIIHIGRHQRPMHYSIMQEIPWQHHPLVRRAFRKVAAERLVPPRGDVRIPLAEDEVRTAARELARAGVEAVAVCFLFSYLNPAHEERAKKIVLEEFPQAFVTTSSSVVPQFREFERFTTTAMNAFIGPKVRHYVGQLVSAMRRCRLDLGPADHALERRAGDAADGRRTAGIDLALGAGRRRPRRRLVGSAVGPPQAHHLRHRRHQRRYRRGDRRPLQRSLGARYLGWRLSSDRADDRHPHDRRRRRQHRLCRLRRHVQGRTRERRFAARPRCVRPRRRAADRDRRQSGARTARRRQLSRRQHGARRRRRRQGDRRTRQATRPRCAGSSRRRSHRRQQQYGECDSFANGAEGHRSARVCAGRVRRRWPTARRGCRGDARHF